MGITFGKPGDSYTKTESDILLDGKLSKTIYDPNNLGKDLFIATNLIYVSNNGDDITGNGSLNAPFKTSLKASQIAVSGDLIKLLPGTYTSDITLPVGVDIAGVNSSNTIYTGKIIGSGANHYFDQITFTRTSTESEILLYNPNGGIHIVNCLLEVITSTDNIQVTLVECNNGDLFLGRTTYRYVNTSSGANLTTTDLFKIEGTGSFLGNVVSGGVYTNQSSGDINLITMSGTARFLDALVIAEITIANPLWNSTLTGINYIANGATQPIDINNNKFEFIGAGLGTARLYNLDSGLNNITIRSQNNAIRINGFTTNYFANIGDTDILESFGDNQNAIDGVTGLGEYKQNILWDFFNGCVEEKIDFTVTATAGVVTGSLQSEGGGDLTLLTSKGKLLHKAGTVILTPGTDEDYVINYVYIDNTDNILKSSTTDFPTTEHTKIARVKCQSAATMETDGYSRTNQYVSDEISDINGNGHLSHINDWIASQYATYEDGMSQSYTGNGTNTVNISVTSGVMRQRHINFSPEYLSPADFYITNDFTASNRKSNNLASILVDSLGTTLNNKYFALVLWQDVGSVTATSHLNINVPSGSYNSEIDARNDLENYTNYYLGLTKNTGVLIHRYICRFSSGNLTIFDGTGDDLRGSVPGNIAGSSVSIPTEFPDSTTRLFNATDITKKTAFDLSGITTGTTRTLTIPDKDGTLATKVPVSTDNALVRFNGTTGDLQDSGVIVNDTGKVSAVSFDFTNPTDMAVITGNSFSDTAYKGTRIGFNRARGTKNIPTSVANNDTIGWFDFFGQNTTGNNRAAQMSVKADGTPTDGITPGKWIFSTGDTSGILNKVMELLADKSTNFFGDVSIDGDVNATVSTVVHKLSEKANSVDVYTKTETDDISKTFAKGSSLGLEQSLLANAGQPAKTVLAVGFTSTGKVQGTSLGNGNVIEVYASGSDYSNGTVLYREFMSLGEVICFTGLSNGAIITSTEGFYGFSENINGANESPMPLLSLGLSFKSTFFYAFRNSTVFLDGTNTDRAVENVGTIAIVNGPLPNTIKLTDGLGVTVQDQENISLEPWEFVILGTDGNKEYILSGTDDMMACVFSHNGYYDCRLIMPLTNDGITWARSGSVSAAYDNTRVDWYVRDGVKGEELGSIITTRENITGVQATLDNIIDNRDTYASITFTTGATAPTLNNIEAIWESGGTTTGISLAINENFGLSVRWGVSSGLGIANDKLTSAGVLLANTQYTVVIEFDITGGVANLHYQQASDDSWFTIGRVPEDSVVLSVSELSDSGDFSLAGSSTDVGGYSTNPASYSFTGTIDSIFTLYTINNIYMDVSPGAPVNVVSATGVTESHYVPDGVVRFLATGLISAYSGADGAGSEATPLMPTSAMSQIVAQPMFISDSGHGGGSSVSIASPYEGTAKIYEWNDTTKGLDLAYTIPITRTNVTVTTAKDQKHPCAGQLSNEIADGVTLLVGQLNAGIIISDVPITVVIQNNSSSLVLEIRSQNGTTTSIISESDETLMLGHTPEDIRMQIKKDPDDLSYKLKLGTGGVLETSLV